MLTEGDVDIDEGATSFTAYGVLELKLTSDVDAADVVACLKDTREVATAADSPAVNAVTETGSGTYDLTLSRYQLPVAYELSVAVGSPPVVRTAVLAADDKARVAFITTAKGDGDLPLWPNAVSSDPLVAADETCTAEANAAGLAGNYTAFLSANTVDQVDAICRLRGGSDVLTADCGIEPLSDEALHAPYLDLKGLPIVYGTADVEVGLWRLPLGYTSTGGRASRSGSAWTGSTLLGVFAGGDCDGWYTSDAAKRANATGNPGASAPSSAYSSQCDGDKSLLCFSAGEGHPLSVSHERTGKHVFVAEVGLNADVDVATADAACQAASGSSDTVAWFSDETDDALCRLLGLSGKVNEDCGEDTLPVAEGPWVRSDGYVVAADSQLLVEAGPLAPIPLFFDGSYAAPDGTQELVRTDTHEWGGRGTITSDTTCISGDRLSIGSDWSYLAGTCSSAVDFRAFVYCFER